MSGIYIHIPFCASRCIYCDFYSTTIKGKANKYVDAILKEYEERSDFLPCKEPLRTIYIGGGTPSQLPPEELARLINSIIEKSRCLPQDKQEITIEANPEDITEEYCSRLFNNDLLSSIEFKDILRVSLGVQSLNDNELQLINRRHDSKKPAMAVKFLREAGIKNISLDLMYGLPTQTIQTWEESIDGIIALEPEHISAYCLSIEEGTRLYKLVDEGKLSPADDELCLEMADILRKKLKTSGYVQYEISNYAKPGFESKHNSSYWDRTPYLGLGPGAHSYDGKYTREWNESDLESYLNGKRIHGKETLTEDDIFKESVMLGLRTNKGVNIDIFDNNSAYLQTIENLTNRQLVKIKGNNLILTESGLAIADEIIRDFF